VQHGFIGREYRATRGQESKSHKGPMTMKNSSKKRMLIPIAQRSPRSESGMPPIGPSSEGQTE